MNSDLHKSTALVASVC